MNAKTPLIAPSLLSADFANLASELKDIQKAGADWLHLDVMDGHFVPNLTIGPLLVEALRPLTKLPLDCHLMVSNPDQWLEPFAKAGADIITIHVEATKLLEPLLKKIRALGCKAGVSLNPATPVSALIPYLPQVDLVLVMSVNPGFAGQKFIESALPKIEELKKFRGKNTFLIEVDGGINPSNVNALAKAGADVFVAGSAIFSKKDRTKAVKELREKCKN